MINIKQDPVTRQWGYEIVEKLDGGGGMRILDSAFEGFEAPNAVYPFVQALQRAFLEHRIKVGRDRESGTYGFQVFEEVSKGQFEILAQGFGFQNAAEVETHISDLTGAIREEVKTIFPQAAPQKSKKVLTTEEIKGVKGAGKFFRVEEDE